MADSGSALPEPPPPTPQAPGTPTVWAQHCLPTALWICLQGTGYPLSHHHHPYGTTAIQAARLQLHLAILPSP